MRYRRGLPEALPSDSDEFVAIHEGRLVGSGTDKLEVARLAYDRFA